MTSSTAVAAGYTSAAFESFLAARNEPDWLTALRREAWKTFEESAWPSRSQEEWIRTDIRAFKLDRFALPGENVSTETETPAGLLAAGVELAGSSRTLDSRGVQAQLDPALAAQGVVFSSLDDAVRTHGELVRKHLFTQAVNYRYDKFSALHAACWAGGHFLYVPRGRTVALPFHALSAMSPGGIDFDHLLVVLEDGAEATLLCETSGGGENPGLHCGASEVVLGAGSRMRLVGLQDWSRSVWHFAHQKAIVGRDASLQWTIAALGSRLAKVNQHVALAGPGASCQVNGVMFAEHKQHVSYHTLQHHEAPHCKSDFLYKTALQDQARTVWRGMIKVDPKADKTDGYQRNDNLMLSAESRADSIPGLEIEADDVRCTHGSTTGKVDEELTFYCQSRGLTAREAARMIVAGFFQQVFDRITIDSVRDALAAAIGARVREYR